MSTFVDAAKTPKERKKREARIEQKRRTKYAKNPLYNPGAQLSGLDLHRAVQGLVDQELGPQESALERQVQNTGRQGAALLDRNADYYKHLATEAAGEVARMQALSSGLRTSLAGVEAGAAAGINEAERQARERAAATSHTAPASSERLDRELAAQRARAAQTGAAFKSAGELQASGAEQFSSAIGQARQLRGGEVQRELTNRIASQRAELEGRLADVRAQRGPLATKNLLGLRQTGFENLATVKGLDLKAADLEADQAQAKAAADLAARRQREAERANRAREGNTRRGQDLSHADRAAAEAGRNARHEPRGRKPRFTRAEVRRYEGMYEKARSLLGGSPRSRSSEAEMRHFLRDKGISLPWIAQAAVQVHIYGGVGDATRRQLKRRYGFGSKLPKMGASGPAHPSVGSRSRPN
ncbi:MAG TPA: hypothetical protein VF712_10770 [Thermoleophilaceae bacterium]